MYCALVLIKYTDVSGENVTVPLKEVSNIIDTNNRTDLHTNNTHYYVVMTLYVPAQDLAK